MRSTWAEDTPGVLEATGVCSTGTREPWALGRWRVDDRVLEFVTAGGAPRVSVPLPCVRLIETTRRTFLVVAKPVLVVTYQPYAAPYARRVWLLTGDLPTWESRIGAEAPALPSPPGGTRASRAGQLARALDLVSSPVAELLETITAGGPATSAAVAASLRLDEGDSLALADLVAAEFADLDRALGAPALRYERRRFDRSTGAVHSMRWWLDDLVAGMWQARIDPLEVQVDGDTVVAILTVPTRLSERPVSARLEPDGLGLLLEGGSGYRRYVELPVAVADDVAVTVHSTGTLVAVGHRVPGSEGPSERGGS